MAESDLASERRGKAASVAISEDTHSGDDRTLSSDSPIMRHTSLSTQERKDINDIVDSGFATPVDDLRGNNTLKSPSRPGHVSPSPVSTPVKPPGGIARSETSDNPQNSQALEEPAIDIGFYGDGGLTAWDGVAARRRSQDAPEPVTVDTRREEALSRDEANVEDLAVDIGFYGDGGLTAWDYSGHRRRSLEAPEILPPELEEAAAKDHARGPGPKPNQNQRAGGVSPEPSVLRRDTAPPQSFNVSNQPPGGQRLPPMMQQSQAAYAPAGQSQLAQNRDIQQGGYVTNTSGLNQVQTASQMQNARDSMPYVQNNQQTTSQIQNTRESMSYVQGGQQVQQSQAPVQYQAQNHPMASQQPSHLDQNQRKYSGGAPVTMSGALPQGSPQVSRTDTVYSADVRPKKGSQFSQGAPQLPKEKKKRTSLFAGLFKSDSSDPSGKKKFGRGKNAQPQMVPSQYAVPPPHMLNQQQQQGYVPGPQGQGPGPQQFTNQLQQYQSGQQQQFSGQLQPSQASQQQQYSGQHQQYSGQPSQRDIRQQQYPSDPQQHQSAQQQQFPGQPQQNQDPRQQSISNRQLSQGSQLQYQASSLQQSYGGTQQYQGRPQQFQGTQSGHPMQATTYEQPQYSLTAGQLSQAFPVDPPSQPQYREQQSTPPPPPGQRAQPIPFYQTQSSQQSSPPQRMQASTPMQPSSSTQGPSQSISPQSAQLVQSPQHVPSPQTTQSISHPLNIPPAHSEGSRSQSPQSVPSPQVTQKRPETQVETQVETQAERQVATPAETKQTDTETSADVRPLPPSDSSPSLQPAQSVKQTPTSPQPAQSSRSSATIERPQMNNGLSQPVSPQHKSVDTPASSMRALDDESTQPKLYWDETQQAYTTQSSSKAEQTAAERHLSTVSSIGPGRESTFPTRFALPLSGAQSQRGLPQPPSSEDPGFSPPPGPPPGWMERQGGSNGHQSAPVSKFTTDQRWSIANPSGQGGVNGQPLHQHRQARGSLDQGMPPRVVQPYPGQLNTHQSPLGIHSQSSRQQFQGERYQNHNTHIQSLATQQPSTQQRYQQSPQPQGYASQSQSSVGQQSSGQEDNRRFSFASDSDQVEILNVVHAPAQPVRPTQVTMSGREGVPQYDGYDPQPPPPPAKDPPGWRTWAKK